MSYCHLSSEERYVISHLVLYDLSLREIGRRLKRNPSTISREIKRNRPAYNDKTHSTGKAFAASTVICCAHAIRVVSITFRLL